MKAVLEKLRLWLTGGRKQTVSERTDLDAPEDQGEARLHQPEPGPHAHLGEHGAAHADDDPEDLHHGRRRLKESHTSHWDLDYMPREEMEELAKANRKAGDKGDGQGSDKDDQS